MAHEWLKWVREFFTQQHTRGFKPSLERNGKTLTFATYAEKLQFQCKEKVILHANGNKQKERYCFQFLGSLWRNIDKIVVATPSQMDSLIKGWHKRQSWTLGIIEELSSVLTPYYDAVAKKYGNRLVEMLGVKTCPYCNRQFIHSFKGIRTERPELDHFLPKDKNPIFCLSFYNLIPACHGCNHEKLEDMLYVNPYDRGFATTFMITDKAGHKLSKAKIYHLTEKEMKLKFEDASNEELEDIRVLGLEDVYNKHIDYVKELIDKSMAYDTFAQEALVNAFQGAGHHPRQVFDFVWGRHLTDAEYEDRPLSKLTKDVLEQLDIRRR